jgi:pimeloyl-ACP methyl ester carboxylesterase
MPGDFGLVDYANCLAALIEALALGPAHVAGLSWGATVVEELYRHHRELVATLILIDTYAGWKGSLPAEEVTRPGRGRTSDARTKLVVIPDCGHVSNLEQPEQFNAAVREFCRAHSPR